MTRAAHLRLGSQYRPCSIQFQMLENNIDVNEDSRLARDLLHV